MAEEIDASALLRTFTIYRDQLLSARDKASREPGSWGGWSVRFNQRLRGVANRFGLLPDMAELDAEKAAIHEVYMALRSLWDEMNRTIAGESASVARARLELETALVRARQQRLIGDDRS